MPPAAAASTAWLPILIEAVGRLTSVHLCRICWLKAAAGCEIVHAAKGPPGCALAVHESTTPLSMTVHCRGPARQRSIKRGETHSRHAGQAVAQAPSDRCRRTHSPTFTRRRSAALAPPPPCCRRRRPQVSAPPRTCPPTPSGSKGGQAHAWTFIEHPKGDSSRQTPPCPPLPPPPLISAQNLQHPPPGPRLSAGRRGAPASPPPPGRQGSRAVQQRSRGQNST